MDLAVVYATFPDRPTAAKIARAMLERRLCACVTMWPAESSYWWEGAIEEARETLAFFKTAPTKVDALREAIAEEHPHDVPCVLPLAVKGAQPEYARWVHEETAGR